MTSWLRSPNSRKSWNDWADDVASGVEQERNSSRDSRHRTPTASTAVDEGLPPPAIHGERRSIDSGFRKRRKSARFGIMRLWWAEFKNRLGTGSAPSSTSVNDESAVDSTYMRKMNARDDGAVDEVVVDRVWSDEFHSTLSHSEQEENAEKSGSHNHPVDASVSAGGTAEESLLLSSHLWHILMEVFSSRFEDEKKEWHYQQEDWYVKKTLAIPTSVWLIISWALGCVFTKLPGQGYTLGDQIFLFAIAPVFTIPLLVMALYNWPRDRPYIYQVTLLFAVWCWSFYQVIYMRVCGYYTGRDCNGRDFMSTFYYTTGLQTVGMFGLKLNRFPAAVGALSFFLFSSIAIVPVRLVWIRNMINFFIFHSFLIYVHYMRESSERRLYTLRDQLKIQYKATQKAQVNERKASDSKRRLTSYVRVPLNTALLAVQNMGASGTVAKDQEIEFTALSGSLSMMSKVLNDVLDFNRLDSGKFESASKPYAFHQVMRSLFIPLRLATDARGLEFEFHLDPNIDKLARRLAYEAMGETQEAIKTYILEHPDVDGVVTGDEARLRQIITNLASNACKFTSSGGKLTITTKLILPKFSCEEDPLDVVWMHEYPPPPAGTCPFAEDGVPQCAPLSAGYLTQHNINYGAIKRSIEHIVVRIEVQDTGCGIKYQDMMHNKLFTAFNQTEQGIQQGGKGTGLGLALVRQIVKLSGGRLGVMSRPDEGSTFWVELPLGVGRRTFASAPTNGGQDTSTPPSDTSRNGRLGNWGPRHHLGLFETPFNDHISMPTGEGKREAKIKSEAMKEHQALFSLMEQGGRVDLGLGKPDERNLPRELVPNATPTSGETLLPPTPVLPGLPVVPDIPTSPPPVYHPDSSGSRYHKEVSFGEVTPSTLEEGRRNRPTYLPMPTPRTFSTQSIENQPPLTTSTYQTSSSSSTSPMTAFDNCFTHGSPASSNGAVNIEPGLNVLVVDDDPLTRTLMNRILTRLGCRVTTAENGEMAVDMILGKKGYAGAPPHTTPVKEIEQPAHEISAEARRRSDIDTVIEALGPVPEETRYSVVFLDNQMPVMSGVKAVERLRQLGRKDFVVGVTGNALLGDQQEYLAAGVDRILTKPVLERSLREILSIAEDRKKAALKEARLSLKTSQSSSNDPPGQKNSLELTLNNLPSSSS